MENIHSVDETMMESVLDDAAQAPETSADALSEALGITSSGQTSAEAGQRNVAEGDLEEPADKGLRGRMKQFEQRGYNRGAREAESKWEEERRGYQQRLARYEQMELETEAKRLAQEKNMPEEIALEYLQLKKGIPATEQPRSEDGRFAPAPGQSQRAEQDSAQADAHARATVLMTQAEAFEKMSDGAVDKDAILDAFKNDPDIRLKVVSGEWDFTDVGRSLMNGTKPRSPMVNRSATRGRVNSSPFATMSAEDFRKFDDRIKHGEVFDARR